MTPERDERLTAVLNKRQPDITVVLENVFAEANADEWLVCSDPSVNMLLPVNTANRAFTKPELLLLNLITTSAGELLVERAESNTQRSV